MYAARQETTSLVLVEEFAHRVVNEYTRAIAGLVLAARQAPDESARCQLLKAADRLHAQAHAHRTLAMPAAEADCDVAEYIARVCLAVANALQCEPGLQLNLGTFEATWPSDRCWRLALIVSELIHNAARHGDGHGEIVVELSSAGSELVCQVNNPAACPVAPNLGRGRRVIAALAHELGGRADWLFTPTSACAWVAIPLDSHSTEDLQ
jgi:two-component sensor histidine kinase